MRRRVTCDSILWRLFFFNNENFSKQHFAVKFHTGGFYTPSVILGDAHNWTEILGIYNGLSGRSENNIFFIPLAEYCENILPTHNIYREFIPCF